MRQNQVRNWKHVDSTTSSTLWAVVKVVLWSGGGAHLTKPGWSKSRTHSNPTNLVLFRHKITLYIFNQGGSYYCRGGAQMGAGGWAPPSPPHFNHWLCFECKKSYGHLLLQRLDDSWPATLQNLRKWRVYCTGLTASVHITWPSRYMADAQLEPRAAGTHSTSPSAALLRWETVAL